MLLFILDGFEGILCFFIKNSVPTKYFLRIFENIISSWNYEIINNCSFRIVVEKPVPTSIAQVGTGFSTLIRPFLLYIGDLYRK